MYIYSLCDWSIEDFGYISWHLGLYESGSKTFHRLCGQSSASSTSQAPRHALATWKENAGGRFQAPVFFLPKETRHRFTTQHNFLLSKERRKPRIKQGTTPNKLASALQLGWRWPNALRSSFKKHPCAWYDDTTSSSFICRSWFHQSKCCHKIIQKDIWSSSPIIQLAIVWVETQMGFFCKPKFDCLLPVPCLSSTPNPHQKHLGFATKRSRGSLPLRLEDGRGCANISVVESWKY